MAFDQFNPLIPENVPADGDVLEFSSVLNRWVAAATSTLALRRFIYTQSVAASTWTIVHNLNLQGPTVTVVDTAGDTVLGTVVYVDANTLIVSFSGAMSGTAYIN